VKDAVLTPSAGDMDIRAVDVRGLLLGVPVAPAAGAPPTPAAVVPEAAEPEEEPGSLHAATSSTGAPSRPASTPRRVQVLLVPRSCFSGAVTVFSLLVGVRARRRGYGIKQRKPA
jgi:hypothetical protein